MCVCVPLSLEASKEEDPMASAEDHIEALQRGMSLWPRGYGAWGMRWEGCALGSREVLIQGKKCLPNSNQFGMPDVVMSQTTCS